MKDLKEINNINYKAIYLYKYNNEYIGFKIVRYRGL